jgi:hypothetical protein
LAGQTDKLNRAIAKLDRFSAALQQKKPVAIAMLSALQHSIASDALVVAAATPPRKARKPKTGARAGTRLIAGISWTPPSRRSSTSRCFSVYPSLLFGTKRRIQILCWKIFEKELCNHGPYICE